MANVYDVADFFVRAANQGEDDQITNLKLNKLLYYSQGAFLARTGKPLFDNNIEAWKLGPVVPEIYRKYKICAGNPIFSDEAPDRAMFTSEEFDVLLDVFREYGKYTGSALVALTHRAGTPWSNTMEANGNSGNGIVAQADMMDYFSRNPVPTLKSRLRMPVVDALPADWYDPEEDAEWEAYL